MSYKNNRLTKYPEGSVKELITIALPLGLASMSFHLMLFFDRILLSKFSIEAMNAAGSASIIMFAFSFFAISVASIAEVFAGQYYGAKNYKDLARPIWQMIWFSLFLIIPFYLVGQLFDDLIIHENLGLEAKKYFRFSITVSFASALNAALISFYVARGKTKFITINTVLGNVLNIILAYCFIFGVKNWFKPMGLMGAAYATFIAIMVQCVVLLANFLSKANRDQFNTGDYRLDIKLFMNCIKIGLPNGLGHFVEISGWALINYYLCGLGSHFITVYTVTQNFFISCAFYADALQKAVVAITSNAIGANKNSNIKKTLNSAIKLQLVMALILLLPFLVFSDSTISVFINEDLNYLIPMISLALIGCWLYFLIDGAAYIFASIMFAGGDTKFLMVMNSLFSWMFAVLPTFIFIDQNSHPATIWIVIMPIYAAALLIAYYYRYKAGKWKNKLV